MQCSTKKCMSTLALGLLAAASLLQTPAPAGAVGADVPPELTITPIYARGSGCPTDGDTAFVTSPDKKTATVLYKNFRASAPGPDRDQFSNCDVRFKMNYPSGYTFAVVRTSYWSNVRVEHGAKAELASKLYLTNGTHSSETFKVWDTAVDGYQTVTQNLDAPLYVPCGSKRELAIDTRLVATAGEGGQGASIGVIASNTTVKAELHVDWQECK